MLAVTEYARRVREHLADLTTEEITDLTEGMEADLVEALLEVPAADSDAVPTIEQVEARFGPPAAYAAELRSAAGLPSAPDGTASRRRARSLGALSGARGLWSRLVERERRTSRELRDRLEAQPWWPGTKELALTMRPAWWLARAYVLAMIGQPWGAGPFPASSGRWLVLVALVVLSVQWGRGRLGSGRWVRALGIMATTVAIIAFAPVMALVSYPNYVYQEFPVDPEYLDLGPGVFMDGEQVRSFHAFDIDGNPIEQFLLFDDHGRPVVTVPLANDDFYVGGSDERWYSVPPLDVYGKAVWNVYPLQLGRWNWLTWDEVTGRWMPARELTLFEPPRPFDRAIPLEAAVVEDEVSDDAEPGDGATGDGDVSPGEDGVAGQGADDAEPTGTESTDGAELTDGAEPTDEPWPDADGGEVGDGETDGGA